VSMHRQPTRPADSGSPTEMLKQMGIDYEFLVISDAITQASWSRSATTSAGMPSAMRSSASCFTGTDR
jgi:hypothetical protein